MPILLIATRNAHKVAEIAAILGPAFDCRSLEEFPEAPAVTEDAPDFAGNAAKKAIQLAAWIPSAAKPRRQHLAPPLFVLADDSGLEVDAIDGAPGVHSARFAALDGTRTAPAGNSPDAANNAKLLRLLADVPHERRTARFRCVLALIAFDPDVPAATPRYFEGTCEGRIGLAPSGQAGFGYDPLFIPTGYPRSFAELGEAEKNRMSHRASALQGLLRHFRSRPSTARSLDGEGK